MKKIDLLLVLLIITGTPLFLLVGCGSKDKQKNTYVDPYASGTPVAEKYSIAADRKAIEELRKNVPQEKKQENEKRKHILMTNQIVCLRRCETRQASLLFLILRH